MGTKRFRIAATGHRPNKLYGYNLHDPRWLDLGRKMRGFLLGLLEQHDKLLCISGMALGVDQLFALVALKLRDQGYNVRVQAALPCDNQNAKWSSDEYWRNILERADERIVVCPGPYQNGCLQMRNKYMVKNADIILAVWNGSAGGTANCVKYAQKKNVPVFNVFNIYAETPCPEQTHLPKL